MPTGVLRPPEQVRGQASSARPGRKSKRSPVVAIGLDALQNHRDALADADAHGDQRIAPARALQLPRGGYAVDDRLREIGYGRWEGLTLPEMELHDAATFAARNEDKWGVAAPAGESYASVMSRVREWFESLVADTVAVAHGGTMRALMVALGLATPLEASETPIGQGVVYVFSDGGLRQYG